LYSGKLHDHIFWLQDWLEIALGKNIVEIDSRAWRLFSNSQLKLNEYQNSLGVMEDIIFCEAKGRHRPIL
jgi:hypothetical protein